ncbi:hypothetical protein [Brachybacterium sp. EE-P12]|uniref:Uncharacterized protein n=1 Tax=Candidatus Brachybacterium intestinipullorum TaxID=2838512 RepID=A0A9D2PWA7_9MICO|nr:hypothetical protein [Brachybacterium sp. EE-P12]HJC68422.1 hypothetical protein [Candidatus Brachybacterium intestinipullorum]
MATNSPQQAPHDPSPTDLPAEDGALAEQIDERWLALIDAALKVQAPLARTYVAHLRAKHPGATDRQLLEKVTARFTALTTATGAGIGGVAALPGLGTAAAVGLTVGEGLSFAESCAFLTLAAADIHGVDMTDRDSRRLVLMGVLGGERGAEIIAKALGRQGLRWNSVLGGGGGFLPGLVSSQITRYVRRRVVSRTGGLWIARLLPFGIGALLGGIGARVVARSVVEALLEIFGPGADTLELSRR